MEFFINNIIVILFLPIWISFIIFFNNFADFSHSKKLTYIITFLNSLAGFIFSLGCLYYFVSDPMKTFEMNLMWLPFNDFSISFGILVDKLSCLFLSLFFFVNLVVQTYSYHYLIKNTSFHMFFIILNLFNFSVVSFLLSNNLIQSCIFLTLINAICYLFNNFSYNTIDVSNKTKNMFLLNGLSDICLFTSVVSFIYFILNYSQETDVSSLLFINLPMISLNVNSFVSNGIYLFLISLFLISIVIRMGIFPFHTGPLSLNKSLSCFSSIYIPIVILLLPIFLFIRIWPVFSFNENIFTYINYFILLSSIIFAICAIYQKRLNKVLIYLALSKFAIVFVILNLGYFDQALYIIICDVVTFTLLFLISGLVLYNFNYSDNLKYIKLNSKIPLVCFLIGIISLSNLFFAGFFSLKSISYNLLADKNIPLLIILDLVSFLVTFALFRLFFLLYNKDKTFDNKSQWIRLPIVVITLPLVLLCLFEKYFASEICSFKFNFISKIYMIFNIIAVIITYKLSQQNALINLKPKLVQNIAINNLYAQDFFFIFKRLYKFLCKVINKSPLYILNKISKREDKTV